MSLYLFVSDSSFLYGCPSVSYSGVQATRMAWYCSHTGMAYAALRYMWGTVSLVLYKWETSGFRISESILLIWSALQLLVSFGAATIMGKDIRIIIKNRYVWTVCVCVWVVYVTKISIYSITSRSVKMLKVCVIIGYSWIKDLLSLAKSKAYSLYPYKDKSSQVLQHSINFILSHVE